MKVRILKDDSAILLKAKAEIIFSAGFKGAGFCEIYTTYTDKNSLCVSTRFPEEKESRFGVGITILSDERIAEIRADEDINTHTLSTN